MVFGLAFIFSDTVQPLLIYVLGQLYYLSHLTGIHQIFNIGKTSNAGHFDSDFSCLPPGLQITIIDRSICFCVVTSICF